MATKRSRRRRCLHCRELYKPDSRNRDRQCYCSAADCRQASRKASQALWLSKTENRNYFRGSANTQRNRLWREAHPGYWKRSSSPRTQQDRSPEQTTDEQRLAAPLKSSPQQDPLELQLPVVVGLIANLSDSTQQETIDRSWRRLHALGTQVLAQAPEDNGLSVLLRPAPVHTRSPP